MLGILFGKSNKRACRMRRSLVAFLHTLELGVEQFKQPPKPDIVQPSRSIQLLVARK
jgi:hypothetical protein